jgi:hypothetical protein
VPDRDGDPELEPGGHPAGVQEAGDLGAREVGREQVRRAGRRAGPDRGPPGDELVRITLTETLLGPGDPHDTVGAEGLGLHQHPRQRRVVPAVEGVDVGPVPTKAATAGGHGRRCEVAAAHHSAAAPTGEADPLDDAAHDLTDGVETHRLHTRLAAGAQQGCTDLIGPRALHPGTGSGWKSLSVPVGHTTDAIRLRPRQMKGSLHSEAA